MPIPLIANPNAYLASPVRRETHGAKLFWLDGETKQYIAVDCIPSFDYTQSSTVTQFPVQDGTVFSDHIIHFPDQLKLEIAQTNEPMEDMSPDGTWKQFDEVDTPLEVSTTSFRPRGLLLLSLMGEQALGAVISGFSNLVGIGGAGPLGGPMVVALRKPTNVRDRINELLESLRAARLGGRLLTLQWLGQVWSNLALETITYKRTSGSSKGEFSVVVTQVNTTTTDTATLPSPTETRLKAETTGGQKPAAKPKSEAEEEAVEESLAHAIIF